MLYAELADMQIISKYNKILQLLLCIIDIYSKYELVFSLENITITFAFQKILYEYGRKPNNIWLEKSSKFYNRSMKSRLQNNHKKCIQHLMKEYLLLLKDLITTLKGKFYKYMN